MFGKGSSDRSRGPEERTQGERLFPHAGYAHIRGLFDPSKPWPERMARPFAQANYQHLNRSLRSLFAAQIIYRFAFSFDHRDLYPFVWMPSAGCRSNVTHNVIKDRSLQLSFARLRVRFYKFV